MYLIPGYTLIMRQVLCVKFSHQLTEPLPPLIQTLNDCFSFDGFGSPIVGKMLYALNRWTWKCFLCNTMTKRDTFQGLLTQNFNKDKALAKDVDPKSPCACLFVGHDHLQEKR